MELGWGGCCSFDMGNRSMGADGIKATLGRELVQGELGNMDAGKCAFLRTGKSSVGLAEPASTDRGFTDLKTGGEYISPGVGGTVLPFLVEFILVVKKL